MRRTQPYHSLTAPIDVDDDAPLRPFLWVRRFAVLAVIVPLTFGVSWKVWDWRAGRSLAAEQAEWRRVGLPMAPEPLQEPTVPDDRNAAALIRRAVASDVLPPHDPAGSIENVDAIPWPEPVQQAAERSLALNAQMFAIAREIPTRDEVAWPPREPDEENADRPFLSRVRSVAMHHALDGQVALQRGDTARFLNNAFIIDAIGHDLSQRPDFISFIVGRSVRAIGLNMVMTFAHRLDLDATTRGAAEDLVRRYLRIEPGDADLQVRGMAREVGAYAQSMTSPLDAASGRAAGAQNAHERAVRFVWAALRPERKYVARAMMTQARSDAVAFRDTTFAAAKAALAATPKVHLPDFEPATSVLGAVFPSAPTNEPAIRFRYQHDMSRRMAAVILAARLYALDHGGQPPPSLAAMVPNELPAVPADPFSPTGAPLGYRFDASGAPFVYSVREGQADLIASGSFVPTKADDGSGRTPNYVAHLVPPISPKPATLPSYPAK